MTRSVRTYIDNGNKNGAPVADPSDTATLDDLYENDITTPGFIRLPVCSADLAWKAWDAGVPDRDSSQWDIYPCNVPEGLNLCGDSTFVGQTTEASPSIDDCLQIVENIRGTDGKWNPENAVGEQHEGPHYGSCAVGFQSLDVGNGNINYHVGSQDVVDIIHESIDRFAWNGKVGAKGHMKCKGTVGPQPIEWGLY